VWKVDVQVEKDWEKAMDLLNKAGLFVKSDWAFKQGTERRGWCWWYGPVESVVAVLRMNGFEVVMVHESVFRF